MNTQEIHQGFWQAPFFAPLKQTQHLMTGMATFGPQWDKHLQLVQHKQRQMMLMNQQPGNLMIQAPPPPPMDMDMPISPTSPIRMTSPRKSGKADRRAEHNAIERARRESLNVKFQQLAHALPNLQDDRRPSKSRIVEKALEWVRQTFHREQQYRNEIQQLRLENERLRAQLGNPNLRKTASFNDADVPVVPITQPDIHMLSYNWSGLSDGYLFDPSGRPEDFAPSEPQDDDDNSSNEGDYEPEQKNSSSYYDITDMHASQLRLAFSSAMLPHDMKSAIIPDELKSGSNFVH